MAMDLNPNPAKFNCVACQLAVLSITRGLGLELGCEILEMLEMHDVPQQQQQQQQHCQQDGCCMVASDSGILT